MFFFNLNAFLLLSDLHYLMMNRKYSGLSSVKYILNCKFYVLIVNITDFLGRKHNSSSELNFF